jgi:hypothetical protein
MDLTHQIWVDHFILNPDDFSEIGHKIKKAIGCVSEHLPPPRAAELHENKSSRILLN